MKKLFSLIFISLALLLLITSCKDKSAVNDTNECVHTYRDTWSSSATEHWRSATCEHSELKISIAKHMDVNEDGVCEICKYEMGHEHKYIDAWEYDDTYHWHNVSCSHSEEKGSFATHTDSDTNGSCDICAAHVCVLNIYGECTVCGAKNDEMCEHTYSDIWSTDSANHWHAATCPHAELVIDASAHTDADENGYCDVCDYQLGHEHTYAEVWSSSDTHHWLSATCTHSTEKGSLALHTDIDKDASCDVCSAHTHVVNSFGICTSCSQQITDPDYTSLEVILSVILSNKDRVVSGNIDYSNVCTTVDVLESGSTMKLVSKSEKDVYYIFGESSAYYKIDTVSDIIGNQSSDSQEGWYERNGKKVFGVYRSVYANGEVGGFMLDAAADTKMSGYYYAVSTLASAHGAEDLLKQLYKLSISDSASNVVSEYLNDGRYSLSFSYLALNYDASTTGEPNVYYYEVSVSFEVSDMGTLVKLDVVCNCYTNSLDYEDEAKNDYNNDYTYDPATNTITMKPMAIADVYSFSITQTEGVRTYVSEHPRSEFVPESFEIYKDSERTEAIDGAISVTAGKVFYLYLGSFAPVGTSISYLADGFSVSCDSHDVVAFSNAITSSVIINAKKAGTYTVIITAGDIVKSVTVTATGAQQGGAVIPANTVPVVINSANSETRVEFTPDVTGSYTFTAPATVGVVEMSQDGTRTTLVDALTNTNGTPFTVTLEMNVTYVMLFTSSSVGTYYVPFTVVPADTDDGASVTEAELVIGSNEVRQANVTFIYVANSDGTLTLSTGAAINGNVTVSYSINGGEAVDIPLSSKAEISLSSGDEIRIFVIATGYSSLSATLS